MQEYLKLNDQGDIIEYPVFEHHIRNRGLRLDMFVAVDESDKPTINEHLNYVSKAQPIPNGNGGYKQNWMVLPKPESQLRESLKAQLADIRWQHETGGITLPDGTKIDTEREDQNSVTKAYTTLKDGLQSSAEFKSASGWVTVDLAVITPIATAVAQHVQFAYRAERLTSEHMDTLTEAELRDLNVGSKYNENYEALVAAAAV